MSESNCLKTNTSSISTLGKGIPAMLHRILLAQATLHQSALWREHVNSEVIVRCHQRCLAIIPRRSLTLQGEIVETTSSAMPLTATRCTCNLTLSQDRPIVCCRPADMQGAEWVAIGSEHEHCEGGVDVVGVVTPIIRIGAQGCVAW